MTAARPIVDRFRESYREDPTTGCWIWVRFINHNGYGMLTLPAPHPHTVRAHRWSYEHFVGPIPPRWDVDHVCRNRACVNPSPEHLQAVPHRVNCRRGREATKKMCRRGHVLTGLNLRVTAAGGRICLRCRRQYKRRWNLAARLRHT